MPETWNVLTALADRSRRALYDYVRRQDHPVSREEAAEVQGISRGLAAFHLDKLVDAGLLRSADRAPGTGSRGRGRRPKVYEAADDTLMITVPERRYQLLAEILADAVADDPADAVAAAHRQALAAGRAAGQAVRGSPEGLLGALRGLGFEPDEGADGDVQLGNCPFQALAARHTALVCGLNHAFLTGLVEGLDSPVVPGDPAPRPGGCCVTLAAS